MNFSFLSFNKSANTERQQPSEKHIPLKSVNDFATPERERKEELLRGLDKALAKLCECQQEENKENAVIPDIRTKIHKHLDTCATRSRYIPNHLNIDIKFDYRWQTLVLKESNSSIELSWREKQDVPSIPLKGISTNSELHKLLKGDYS